MNELYALLHDAIIAYINSTCSPEDVFDHNVLVEWAESNGFTQGVHSFE